MLAYLGFVFQFSVNIVGLKAPEPVNVCMIEKAQTCFCADCDSFAKAYPILSESACLKSQVVALVHRMHASLTTLANASSRESLPPFFSLGVQITLWCLYACRKEIACIYTHNKDHSSFSLESKASSRPCT